MSKTHYQEKMELLGLKEHDLFEIAFNKVVLFTSSLSDVYGAESVLDERSFLLRSIKRMTNLMKSVYVLFKTTSDRASMMILTRSVIDLNAIIRFLFVFVKNNEERALRLNLFYLDGIRTRLKISDEPIKDRDPNYISEEEYNTVRVQMEETRKADLNSEKELVKRIQGSPLCAHLHPSILKKASWKFKKIGGKESYTWLELYEIANEEKNTALFEQEFLSHYVHGVAISDIQYSTINETNPVFALNICCAILNHLDSVFKSWFSEEYNELEEYYKKELGEMLLNNMSPEALATYLKSIKMEER